jgi:hypothetical protein
MEIKLLDYSFDISCYLLFLLNSYIIFNMYIPVKNYLSKYPKFKSYDNNKQFYIIKNLIKALSMTCIFSLLITIVIPNILNGIWVDFHNRIIGAFYVSNDLAGLFAVPNLPSSTKFHHYTSTTLFTLICILSTEHEENIARLIVIYTIFSCIPYLVNSYLALRFFYNRGDELTENQQRNNRILDINRKTAYYIYISCCIFSWLYHLDFLIRKLLTSTLTLPYIMYYLLLVPIINDDIILLRWLKDNRLEL